MEPLHWILDLLVDYYPFFGLIILSIVIISLVATLTYQQKQINLLKKDVKELKWYQD